MSQAILTRKGTVVIYLSRRKTRKSELVCESEKKKRNLFYDVIEKKLGRSMSYLEKPIPE